MQNIKKYLIKRRLHKLSLKKNIPIFISCNVHTEHEASVNDCITCNLVHMVKVRRRAASNKCCVLIINSRGSHFLSCFSVYVGKVFCGYDFMWEEKLPFDVLLVLFYI